MAVGVLAIAGGAAGGSSAADDPRATAVAAATARIEVTDDSYAPKRLKVASGARVRWVWSSRNANHHDVYVDERPDGARRFNSRPARAPFSFTRKLRKPGVYKILCTLHEGMNMRIRVTRKR